jgi:hypothetical protein
MRLFSKEGDFEAFEPIMRWKCPPHRNEPFPVYMPNEPFIDLDEGEAIEQDCSSPSAGQSPYQI